MGEIIGTIILVCVFVFIFLITEYLIFFDDIFESLKKHRNKKLRKMLLKAQYYEAAKYVFKKRKFYDRPSYMQDLNNDVCKTFFETLYAYTKYKCGTDGIMTDTDVSFAIKRIFNNIDALEDDKLRKNAKKQIKNAINNSNFVIKGEEKYAWISDLLPVGLLLLFLVEKEVIVLTDDIPFDKILTDNLSENELGNIISADSKLFAKIKKVKE